VLCSFYRLVCVAVALYTGLLEIAVQVGTKLINVNLSYFEAQVRKCPQSITFLACLLCYLPYILNLVSSTTVSVVTLV
jgi:hypothetical protein